MFDFLRFLSSAPRSARRSTQKALFARATPRLEILEDRSLMTATLNTDFAIPSGNSDPLGIAAGTNGLEWFTENGANKIASINTSTQAITEYTIPTANSGPAGIAVDSQGNIWFTETNANQIAEMNAQTGGITEFAIPTAGSQPYGIAPGPNGYLYFTETTGNKIGEINSANDQIFEFTVPTNGSRPAEIVEGPDGNMWFTENHSAKIGVMNTGTGVITEFATPSTNSQPFGITQGSDGNLWFTENNGDKIGEINPTTHTFKEFSLPEATSGPFAITTGPNGNIWFTEIQNNAIGQINPTTDQITEYALPRSGASAYAIAPGPDGNIWYVESATGYVGDVPVPPSVLLNPKNTAVAPGNTVVFTSIASTDDAETAGTTIIEPGQMGVTWQTFPIATAAVTWEVSINGGASFFPLSDSTFDTGGTSYVGSNTNMLTINDPTTSMTGYKYEAVFANGLISTAATLSVVLPLTITPFLPGGMVGANYTQTIAVSGSTSALSSFTVNNFNAGGTGFSASNLSINPSSGSVIINGTPTGVGTATFTISAANSVGAAVTQAYTIAIVGPLSITPSLPAGIINVKYSQTIAVTGGQAPYTSFALNNLVTGGTGFSAGSFNVNGTAGTITITGTPTALGTMTFSVDVIDTAGNTMTKTYTIAVAPALSITPTVPGDTVNESYNQTLNVAGGASPYASITITGFSAGTTDLTAAEIIPNVAAGTVAIAATPTKAGTATFTVNVVDGGGNKLSKTYSLLVNPAPTLNAPSKTQWTVNQTGFSGTLAITGGTGPFSIFSSANLPTGLSANLSGSIVSFTGIPTAVNAFSGGTITIKDASGATATATFTLTINAAPSFGALTQNQWTVNRPGFTGTIALNSGTAPFTITSATGLPTGMTASISGTSVHFGGTPTAAKAFPSTITVTDAAGAKITTTVTITINPALSVSGALPQGTAGANYAQNIKVSGGTGPFTTFTVTSFNGGATGLTAAMVTANLGAGMVVINGTPTGTGIASFLLTAVDTAGAALSTTFTITVNPAPTISALTRTTWDAAVANFPGTMTISAGTAPYTIASASGLPTGLTAKVTGSTISFTGTASVASVYPTGSVTIQDAAGATVTKNFSITINPALTFTPSVPQGTSGINFNQTLKITGGTGVYTTLGLLSFSAGTTGLPGNAVTVNAGAGTITINGTPTNGGTIILTAVATDTLGATISKTYNLTINAVPYLTAMTTTQWTQNKSGFTGTMSVGAGTLPFSIVSATGLPTGLTAVLSGRTVSFTGTPTVAGTFSGGSITLKDANGATITRTFSITINPQLVIAPPALPTWTPNLNYSATVTTTGGTGVVTFTITAGSLPPGLHLSSTGVISGLSRALGVFTFTVTATDSIGATVSQVYTL